MSGRNDFTKELKRLGRELTGKKNELEAAEKKKPEIKGNLENARRLYETVIAETGESRPELLGESERIERELGFCEATINGLARYVSETLPAKIDAKHAELKDLDRREGQRRLAAMIPDLNSAASKFASLLRDVDEIKFTFAYKDFSFDGALIPIYGDFVGLCVPRFYADASSVPDGDGKYFWTPRMSLAAQVMQGTISPPNAENEINIPARNKTTQEKIFEVEGELLNRKNRFASATEYYHGVESMHSNKKEPPAEVGEALKKVDDLRNEISDFEKQLEILRLGK